jgi:excisionase family DNA binding protein
MTTPMNWSSPTRSTVVRSSHSTWTFRCTHWALFRGPSHPAALVKALALDSALADASAPVARLDQRVPKVLSFALRDAGRRNRVASLLGLAVVRAALIIDQNLTPGPMMSVNPTKPTPLEDKFILTSEEAAEFLGVSLRTIRYWVATRRIPYFHLGRFIRFKPADLTAFLESGRVDPLEH